MGEQVSKMVVENNEFRSVFEEVIVGLGRAANDLRIVEIHIGCLTVEVFIDEAGSIVSLRCVPGQDYKEIKRARGITMSYYMGDESGLIEQDMTDRLVQA